MEAPKPNTRYPKGRRCECGTILSIYNGDDECSRCEEPDPTLMRIGSHDLDVELAKLDRLERVSA